MEKGNEGHIYTWKIGRSLGFEILFKSKCTWFWSSEKEVKALALPESDVSRALEVPSLVKVQRQLSNSSAFCLSRKKKKMAFRCLSGLPMVTTTCLLMFVLYYQIINTFVYVEDGDFIQRKEVAFHTRNASIGETVQTIPLPSHSINVSHIVRRDLKATLPEKNVNLLLRRNSTADKNEIPSTHELSPPSKFVERETDGTVRRDQEQYTFEKGQRSLDASAVLPINIQWHSNVNDDQPVSHDHQTNLPNTNMLTFKANVAGNGASSELKGEIITQNNETQKESADIEASLPPRNSPNSKTDSRTKRLKKSQAATAQQPKRPSSRLNPEQYQRAQPPSSRGPTPENLRGPAVSADSAIARDGNTNVEKKSGVTSMAGPQNTTAHLVQKQAQTSSIQGNKDTPKIDSSMDNVHGTAELGKSLTQNPNKSDGESLPKTESDINEENKYSVPILRRFEAVVSAKPSRSQNGNMERNAGLWQKQSRPAYKSESQYGDKHRLLVLFTTFKRDPSRFRIHCNVIYNWASFRPAVVPVLYNDSSNPTLLTLAKEAGWVVRQVTAYNKHGVPLLRQMYHDVEDQFPSAFLGFANGDILFDEGLVTTLEGVAKHRDKARFAQTMVVGMRHNLFLEKRKLYWPHDVWIAVKKEAVEAPVYAEDYFFIYRNRFPWHVLPDIVIGRPAYDNFLVAVAIKSNVSVVDSSRTLSCVHQYGPGGLGAGRKNTDAEYNKSIIGDFRFDEGYLDQVPYETTFDPKGNIVVWTRNQERQQLLNNIQRGNMSSHWKEHPGSYIKFVHSLNNTGPSAKRTGV